MIKKKSTTWALANKSYLKRDFHVALGLYQDVLNTCDDELKKIVLFNYNLTIRQLGIQSSLTKELPSLYFKNLSTFNKLSFDPEFYLENNPDVKETKMDPENHYWSYGESEGRWPNKHFDPVYYLNVNSDVRVANISPFHHYSSNGFKEGRLGKSKLNDCLKIRDFKSKSLLFVGHDGLLAGAQVFLLEVVRWYFESTNRRIKVLLLGFGPLADRYAQYSEVFTLSNATLDSQERLRNFLDEDFQFVYLNTSLSGRLISILQLNNISIAAPMFANIHEMGDSLDRYSNEIFYLKKVVNHWISGSPITTRHLYDKFAILPTDITTIPAFIRPLISKSENPITQRIKARQQLQIPPSTFLVMACGTAVDRKGPDLFVETAKKLRSQTHRSINFLWIGDGPEKQRLENLLTPEDTSYIKFIGTRQDADSILAAADVFYLSSREDPFPLVVLTAAQYAIPIICFGPATGASTFVQGDAGVVLEHICTTQAVSALHDFINNPIERTEMGNVARQRLYESYTVETKMLDIYDVIKRKSDYIPAVSVIVPFFNHEKYVSERLDSILMQNIKDIEIIALDDCSTDDTVEKIQPYLKNDKRITLLKNKTNSGSPFLQWKLGIANAKSDLIWIAEGDDSCSVNFLNTLLPKFIDPLLNIAFANVEMMDENGKKFKSAFKSYFDSACPGKFDLPYTNSGVNEVREHFCAHQTLINASGLIFRKNSLCQDALELSLSHRMCGDWLIYLGLLKTGKIAYCPTATNFFRRHSKSQVSCFEGTPEYFKERYDVTRYVINNFRISKINLENSIAAVESEWVRFNGSSSHNDFINIYKKNELLDYFYESKKNRLPNILVVASDFSPGGGQMFSIRLANAWKKLGGNVVLLNIGKYKSHPKVTSKILESVPVYHQSDVKLNQLVDTFDIDIVHSSIWWADKFVCENYDHIKAKSKWVITTHGCYETLLSLKDIDRSFPVCFGEMLDKVDYWVYTANKNLQVFEKYGYPKNIKKLKNGYELDKPSKLNRSSLGIRDESFLVCLASRAIPAKGWHVACEAVKHLNAEGLKVDLLLIGEGPSAKDIVTSNKPDYIHLVDQVDNLQDFISISDIGLLPSMFIGESLPLVLIEFMAQGKPIVSTDIGEIVEMTTIGNESCAIILKLIDGKVDVCQLAAGIKELALDSNKRQNLGNVSAACFKSFEMKNIIDEYTNIYKEILR